MQIPEHLVRPEGKLRPPRGDSNSSLHPRYSS